jgi:hypothetical protein
MTISQPHYDHAARYILPGYPHHVTQRSNRRQQILEDNADALYLGRPQASRFLAFQYLAREGITARLPPNIPLHQLHREQLNNWDRHN